MRREEHNLHGTGWRECEVYEMPHGPDDDPYWGAVTGVPCPVSGCQHTVVWYEAGYVPGYRVCMAPFLDGYDEASIRHRFLAQGNSAAPVLVRDREAES